MLKHLDPGMVLLINPFFNQMPPGNFRSQTGPATFILCEDRPYHLAPQGGLRIAGQTQPTNDIRPGRHSDPTRNFRWLPYVAGYITYTPLGTGTILTGIMTGCWLCTFSMGGTRYFGHIGTDSNSVANTNTVKAAWTRETAANRITNVSAFNPARLCQGSSKVFGAVSDGTFVVLGTSPRSGTDYVVETKTTAQGLPAPVL
jgi:hypothetical protein